MTPEQHTSSDYDPWELHLVQDKLQDWMFTGKHHLHKSWLFSNADQALQWHAMARVLSEQHDGDCIFYLGHVCSGRIETDIHNRVQGHLTRDDLNVALMMNVLEAYVKNPLPDRDAGLLRESFQLGQQSKTSRFNWPTTQPCPINSPQVNCGKG